MISILINVSPLCITGSHTHCTMNKHKEHEELLREDDSSIVSESLDIIMNWKPVSDVYVYSNWFVI